MTKSASQKSTQQDNPKSTDDNTNKNTPGHLLEVIDPPNILTERITYKELGSGSTHPVENAERGVEFLSIEFSQWIEDDIIKMQTCWSKLQNKQNIDDNSTAFTCFNKAVHTIKGNAAILGYNQAGELAIPLSKLLERSHDLENFTQAINLIIQAIKLSTIKNASEPETLENICLAFETIIKNNNIDI